MSWTFSLLINAVAVILVAYVLKGVEVKNFVHAIITAAVLGLANTFVKPVLMFVSIPINILTLGLFTLVINALIVLLVSKLLDGFNVKSFGWAFVFSILLSIISGVLFKIF